MAATIPRVSIRLLHSPLSAVRQFSFTGCIHFYAQKCSKRTLFSGDILGIENFKRLRLLETDKIGQERENFVQKLTFAKDDPTVSTALIPDVMKLIYLATTQSEVSLILGLLHKCFGQMDTDEEVADGGNKIEPGQSRPRHFQLGPLFMRLLHILKNTETALTVWQDQKLKNVFYKTTCCLLLMDLLYNEGQYQAVINTFCQMQEAKVSPVQHPPDCTTLALAALYQMNSKEALVEAKQYIEQSRKERSLLSRRSMLFAAVLALNQGDPVYALDIANPFCNDSKKESIFMNVKIVAVAQLGLLKDALDLMERGLWVDVPTQSRVGIIFSDSVETVTAKVHESANQDLANRYMHIQKLLDREGLLSPQTLKHFVERPILRQRKQISQSFKRQPKSRVPTQKYLKT